MRRMSDEALHEDIRRLENDLRIFEARARAQKAALERAGQCTSEDLLYHRFVSLHAHLSAQLQQARAEARRRALRRAKRPGWSLRAGIAALLGARG